MDRPPGPAPRAAHDVIAEANPRRPQARDLFLDVLDPELEAVPAAGRGQGASATPEADRAHRRDIVAAFLTASQEGDFSALLVLLDPDVVLRADAGHIAALDVTL